MRLSLFIAKRYLFSKKDRNAVNVITLIAVTGVMVGTMALVCVLSAFNGIEKVVINLFNAFDPEIKIELAEGKFFEPHADTLKLLSDLEGVERVAGTLEENAMLKYQEKQYIATLKGVDEHFKPMSRLDTMLVAGDFNLMKDGAPGTILGYGVAGILGVNLSGFSPVNAYMPDKLSRVSTNPERAFRIKALYPTGIFTIQHDFDSRYAIVPLDFMQDLTGEPNKVSALELKLDGTERTKNVKEEISLIMGPRYVVKDRFEQHESIYKIMKSERLAVFVILSFILVIATFNIVGSVTMLIIEKKKDIRILHHMGADMPLIRKIFFLEGMLITLAGAFLGLMLGFILCYIQQQFGIIKIPGAFVMDSYPVDMRPLDFVLILVTVISIGALTSFIPAGQVGYAAGKVRTT